MDQMMIEAPEDFQAPVPLDENDHMITVRRCSVRRKRLIPSGEPEELNLVEAVRLLAPTGTHRARANVVKLRAGQYIGVKRADSSNFVIVNPTSDGDIRWLLQDHPNLPSDIERIYVVDGVQIRRNTIDLTEPSGDSE